MMAEVVLFKKIDFRQEEESETGIETLFDAKIEISFLREKSTYNVCI